MNRISRLIIDRLTGHLTEDGEHELQAWAEESVENRALLDRLTDPARLSDALREMEMADPRRACADMQRRVDREQRPRRVMRYAAAAAVAAIVLGACWLMTTGSHDLVHETELMAVAVSDTVSIDDIKHGVVRATLSDASGHTVMLNEKDTAYTSSAQLIAASAQKEVRKLCLDVPRGGEFKIQLADGTEVWLNSDSRLYYPDSFGEDSRRVRVEGEAYFSVATDSLRPFYVETGNQMIRVYGTAFNVRHYQDEDGIYTTLEEGSISLTRTDRVGGALFLTPGHQAVFRKDDSKVNVRHVDTEVVTSWRKGRFVFENQSLLRIMQDLSRWYDFEYEFSDAALESEMFMGSIPRYADFTTAIAILEKCGGISFAVDDGRVIISRLPERR